MFTGSGSPRKRGAFVRSVFVGRSQVSPDAGVADCVAQPVHPVIPRAGDEQHADDDQQHAADLADQPSVPADEAERAETQPNPSATSTNGMPRPRQ